ncbi:MAG: ABC transporter ATP-binding protein [Microthrixaceae bacterium]
MLRRILRDFLLPYRRDLASVVGLTLVSTIAALVLPSISADIIDKGVLRGDTGFIWRHGALMLGISFVQILFAVASVWFGSHAAMAFGRDVRHALFGQVLRYSAREVNLLGAPSLITRITNDVTQVQMLVQITCTLLVGAPIMAIGGTIMALREDVGISVILAVAIPVLVSAIGLIVVRMIPTFRAMQDRIDRVNQVLREQLTGLRVVRAFVREPHETARFGDANGALTATSLRAGRLMAFMFPTVMLVLNMSSVAAIWVGGDRIDSGRLSMGSLVAFLTYLALILMSVMMATFMAILLPRAAVSAERIGEVLDTDTTVHPPLNPVRALPRRCAIEFKDVTFHYPGADEPVLDHVSFRVEPGTTTAIIGSTGSGKTTLLELIPRLFDATAGSVCMGEDDVTLLDQQLLWSRIGMVPQKPYLFSGTVATNLRLSNPDATDEQLWDALTVAQAADFVRAMPDGLDSPIVQGGSNVSGGQRQRLCIARAIVRDAAVFLFDDSFSALDLTTDARLRAALVPRVADAAVLIVAQRVSTIMDADQILVLEDGRTVGLGTHDELQRSCPTYAEIVDSQLRTSAA